MDYKNAGVDIEAGYESVELMKKFVKGTMQSGSTFGRSRQDFHVLFLLKISRKGRSRSFYQVQMAAAQR